LLGIEFIGIESKNDGKLKKLGADKVIENFSNRERFYKLLET
jgi:hypothetical protein